MRVDQQLALGSKQLDQSAEIAQGLVALRLARRVRQSEAAIRAGYPVQLLNELKKVIPVLQLACFCATSTQLPQE